VESSYEYTLSWYAIEHGPTDAKNGQLSDEPTWSTPLTHLDRAPFQNESMEHADTVGRDAWSRSGIHFKKNLVPGFEPDDVPDSLICYTDNGAAYEHFSTVPKAIWLKIQDDANLGTPLDSMLTTTFESTPRFGDDTARVLFRAAGFPDTMDQIARSMTIQTRTGPNHTEVHGSVHIGEQHIHVWPWMILPAGLALLSVVFLIVSMTMATRECRGWKSSVLH
jgi:hypothetical protein